MVVVHQSFINSINLNLFIFRFIQFFVLFLGYLKTYFCIYFEISTLLCFYYSQGDLLCFSHPITICDHLFHCQASSKTEQEAAVNGPFPAQFNSVQNPAPEKFVLCIIVFVFVILTLVLLNCFNCIFHHLKLDLLASYANYLTN